MELEELLQLAVSLPDHLQDCPFSDPDKIVLRHKENRKWFALLFYQEHAWRLDVKCDPYENDALCETYEGICKGWHMNKRHWITIDPDLDVPKAEIQALLKESYELTKPKSKKH